MNKFSKNWRLNLSINLKKPCLFLVRFPKFLGKNNFPENSSLPHATSYWFLAPCQRSEKTNDITPRRCLDRRTDGRTDRPYFIYDPSGSFLGSNKSKITSSIESKKKLIKNAVEFGLSWFYLTSQIEKKVINSVNDKGQFPDSTAC